MFLATLMQTALAATPCQKTSTTRDVAAKVAAVTSRGHIPAAAIRRDETKPCGVETVPRGYRNQIPEPESKAPPKVEKSTSLWD